MKSPIKIGELSGTGTSTNGWFVAALFFLSTCLALQDTLQIRWERMTGPQNRATIKAENRAIRTVRWSGFLVLYVTGALMQKRRDQQCRRTLPSEKS